MGSSENKGFMIGLNWMLFFYRCYKGFSSFFFYGFSVSIIFSGVLVNFLEKFERTGREFEKNLGFGWSGNGHVEKQ